MNKLILLLLLIPNLVMANSDNDCFTQEEANKVIQDFAAQAATSDYLYRMATDELKEDEEVFLNNHSRERQLLITNSTEIIFSTKDGNEQEQIASRDAFKKGKCIWNVTFSLSKKIRDQCDDGGMYGDLYVFKKKQGRTFFYRILHDGRSNEPICKALLKIANKKIDEK